MSDSSDDNSVDGTTNGPAAQGRSHPGGNFKGTSSSHRSVGPLVIQQLGNWPPVNRSLVIHPQNNKSLPVTGQPVVSQINTSQSITGHQSSICISDFSTFVDTHAIGMKFTKNKSNLGSEHSYGHESQNSTNTSRRLLLPLEPDFSNMSHPSVVIEPPDNNWRSETDFTFWICLQEGPVQV